MCETGGARRTWLRGVAKVRKRWLIQAAARNLGLIMRALFGIGTARTLQGEGDFALRSCLACLIALRPIAITWLHDRRNTTWRWLTRLAAPAARTPVISSYSTGC